MSMTPTLFSIEGIATELGRDRRTVARALRDLPPDGEVRGKPAWRLASVIRILNRREGGAGSETAASEIEETCGRLQSGLDRATEIADIEQRRVVLKQIGPLVGKLDRLMTAADNGDIVCELLHREALRDAVAQFTELYYGPTQAPPSA
jgi:hypothetical protein